MTMMMAVIIMMFTSVAIIVVTNIDENVQFYIRMETLFCRLVGYVKVCKREVRFVKEKKMDKVAIINGVPLVLLY